MAVFKTNIQNAAALEEAVNAADAAMPTALKLSSGLERFEGGAVDIFYASSTQITGHFLRPNGLLSPVSFAMWGSFTPELGTSTVTRLEFHDSSTWPPTIAVLAFYGRIQISSGSELEDPTITGSINRIRYTSAELDISMRGNLNVQAFETDRISGITHLDVKLRGEPDVSVSLAGKFTFDESGNVRGTLTDLRFELDDQFFHATGMNRPYSALLEDDVDAMLAALLDGNDRITGQDGEQALNGYAGRDSIYGAGGDDVLMGGGGSDYLNGGDGVDHLDGGRGADTMLWRPGDIVNGAAGYDTLRVLHADLDLLAVLPGDIVDIEQVDMSGGFNSTLTLNEQEVLDLSTTTDILTVLGDDGDTVSLADTWTQGATSEGFTTWTRGVAILQIEDEVNVVMP